MGASVCLSLLVPFLSIGGHRDPLPLCAELPGSPWPGAQPGLRVAVLSLQDLGVTKVGHMKRILCGIKELSRSPPATEA